jgi:hypothetical protein
MKDIYNKKPIGHIVLECIGKDGLVDRYEQDNLIMDAARIAVAPAIAGVSNTAPMNKFVIGTEGHVTGDYLTPKTELEGFISSRTELFSEELSSFIYPIEFQVPGTSSGACTVISEPDTGSTVNLNYMGTDVTFTIEIPELSANNSGVVVFTEAALYAGDNIFSMKCFPGKIKDNTVSLKVIWTIKF